MPNGRDKLTADFERLRRYERRLRLRGPDGPAVLVRVGDVIYFDYDHEPREVTVVAFRPWGFLGVEAGREGFKSFRSDRIGRP